MHGQQNVKKNVKKELCTFYNPDQQMHNTCTNNILYNVSTLTCLNASASTSGSHNIVLAKVTWLLKLQLIMVWSELIVPNIQHKTVQTVHKATNQTNKQNPRVIIIIFYGVYFIIQQRSREHFSLPIWLSSNFNDEQESIFFTQSVSDVQYQLTVRNTPYAVCLRCAVPVNRTQYSLRSLSPMCSTS
jgi:hypothetical protein